MELYCLHHINVGLLLRVLQVDTIKIKLHVRVELVFLEFLDDKLDSIVSLQDI